MKAFICFALLAAAACSSRTAEKRRARDDAALTPNPPSSRIDQRVACGDVTAIWRGERGGAIELWFELGKGATPIRMPTGDLFWSDLSSDIFSPDCSHVLLLYSHNGPYHIVRTARLAEYLRGAAPDHVLAGEPDPKGVTGTGVFHDGAWVSNTTVRYQWGCCDPPVVSTFELPAGK